MKTDTLLSLRPLAEQLGIRVFALSIGEKIKDLEEKITELMDEAQALSNVADKEERELTDEEHKRWTEIMDDESGVLHKLQADLDKANTIAAEKKRLARIRGQMNQVRDFREGDDHGGATINDHSGNANKPRVRMFSRLGRLRAFKGEHAAEDAYLAGQWLKAVAGRLRNQRNDRAEEYCQRHGVILDTATEGTDTAGGFLVPDPLSNAIINYRELSGVSRQIVRVMPMTSDTLDVPKKTGTTTVTYPGEATAGTPSDQTWGQVSLAVKKRMVLSKVSQELNDDAIIAIMDDLAAEIGSDLAIQEDNELVNGDGTATYGSETGLLAALGAAGTNTAETGDSTWDTLDMEDFTDTMALLPDKFHARMPSWLCSTAFYFSVMLRLEAAAGGNTIASLTAGDSGRGRVFLGYPVFLTSQMPTATATSQVSVLFGAFSAAVLLGDRMAIRIDQSKDRYFDEDVLALRATTRYDINVHEGGDGSNAGAYVGLSTSAS